MPALVMNCLAPSITHSPPSSRARVRTLPASEPASGSVSPNAPSLRPAVSSGSHSSCCSRAAEQVDRLRAERRVRAHRDRHRGVDARQLLDRDRVGERVAAGAADLLGERDAHQPELAELGDDLVRERLRRGRAPPPPARSRPRRSRGRCGGSARGRARGRSPSGHQSKEPAGDCHVSFTNDPSDGVGSGPWTRLNRRLTGRQAEGATRRSFIRGIAAAGASTAAAAALERARRRVAVRVATADAAAGSKPFSDFKAIGAVDRPTASRYPEGFRADVLISWGDTFADDEGNVARVRLQQRLPRLLPARRHGRRGHPLRQPRVPDRRSTSTASSARAAGVPRTRAPAQIQIEQRRGRQLVPARAAQDRDGAWTGRPRSRYNRRIYGDRPGVRTSRGRAPATDRARRSSGPSSHGSIGNCSGGITPWGTALSCEENYDGYGLADRRSADFASGWAEYGDNTEDYHPDAVRTTGGRPTRSTAGSASTTRTTRDDKPRKHTALGRFRHENTAFRPRAGQAVRALHGRRQGQRGPLQVRLRPPLQARDRPAPQPARSSRRARSTSPASSRRAAARFTNDGDIDADSPRPRAPARGCEVLGVGARRHRDEAARAHRRRPSTTCTSPSTAPRTSRSPRTARVYMAMTNNSGVKDSHGAVRRHPRERQRPDGAELRVGGLRRGRARPVGRRRRAGLLQPATTSRSTTTGNLWVVTDISSSRLNKPRPSTSTTRNNAMFMVPTRGPERRRSRTASRNMPVESEGTGPYFTPDERTLFVSVQHPGEETSDLAPDDPSWGDGRRTTRGGGGRQVDRPRPVDAASRDRGDHEAAPLAGGVETKKEAGGLRGAKAARRPPRDDDHQGHDDDSDWK